MKRMTHPLHGFHHPLSGAEEQTMLANGWTHEVEAHTVVAEPVAPEAESVVRRRGPNKAKD